MKNVIGLLLAISLVGGVACGSNNVNNPEQDSMDNVSEMEKKSADEKPAPKKETPEPAKADDDSQKPDASSGSHKDESAQENKTAQDSAQEPKKTTSAPKAQKDKGPKPGKTMGGGVMIANPASTNCIDKGGKLELQNNMGVCIFKDGSRCEEWRFMRGQCKKGQCRAKNGICDK